LIQDYLLQKYQLENEHLVPHLAQVTTERQLLNEKIDSSSFSSSRGLNASSKENPFGLGSSASSKEKLAITVPAQILYL
jgi:hypothetical protein